jgi:hypothetical protein
MHASIWTFAGDAGELLRRYQSMLAEVPTETIRLHMCLRATDGIVIIDTCPTRGIFEEFSAGPFPALRKRHGLPEPTRVEDFPVHSAIVNGAPITD